MKPDTVDYASCANDFESFIFLQNKELERLTSKKTQLVYQLSGTMR